MTFTEFLPLGSVVMLKGGEKRLMICGRIQSRADSEEIYQYSACLFPEGIVAPDAMYFFNQDAIDTVYFIGFQDPEELTYRTVLENLGELQIVDGQIVPVNPPQAAEAEDGEPQA